MCYNCGCEIPDDDMGHPDNVTEDTFKKYAGEVGVSTDEFKEQVYSYLQLKQDSSSPKSNNLIIEEMFEKASKAWGQSVVAAKQETSRLLNKNLNK